MNLSEYFAKTEGTGVLSTSDSSGKVDAAVYSAPHFMEDGTLVFLMRERLTHENLKSNPYAMYLFMESGAGHRGVRLFLRKVREDSDPGLTALLTRSTLSPEEDRALGAKFLVYFNLEKVLPLIGGGECGMAI